MMSNHDILMEKAREFQMIKFLGRVAKKGNKRKSVICCTCQRTMETIEEETPPFYCFKCGDKLELGGFHELS